MMDTGEYTAFLKSTHKPICQTVEGEFKRMKRGQRDKQTEREKLHRPIPFLNAWCSPNSFTEVDFKIFFFKLVCVCVCSQVCS